MTNNTTANINANTATSQAIADLVRNVVSKKGTCFAGFTYNGKRRNLTLGLNLRNKIAGVGNWGTTTDKGCIISHNGNLYLQGSPNNEINSPVVKRFKINEIRDFVIG